MNNKFSAENEAEIKRILHDICKYSQLFSVNVDFFIDGYAIFLEEKTMYPRKIVIFKSYTTGLFNIKSFEINLNANMEEEYNLLYAVNDIKERDLLLKELNEIIYGKDLMRMTAEKLRNYH